MNRLSGLTSNPPGNQNCQTREMFHGPHRAIELRARAFDGAKGVLANC